ncbi:MAG: hypothetical protein L6R41_003086 [Letrouitia leprolyta]|nr:MAG: hypothetical protein L6R41_003086 [Letrouitia leprolyta]
MKTPNYYTRFLSSRIFNARVLHCEKAIPAKDRQTIDIPPLLKEYHSKFIQDESLRPLAELCSLRAYGMVIARDHNARPNVTWSRQKDIIYYMDRRIHMDQIPAMVKGVIAKAQEILSKELVSKDPAYLATRDPVHFGDNTQWAGYSFAGKEENDLLAGERRVARWAHEKGKFEDFLKKGNTKREFDFLTTRRYKRRVEVFLDYLMVLCHITSGMPARGTKLTSLKLENTWTL